MSGPDFGLTLRMARRMDKDPQEAAAIRCRYLYEMMGYYLESSSEIADFWFWDAVEEAIYITEQARIQAEKKLAPFENPLDIERAKEYPIESLIDFKNGWAVAWCHQDKRPSLSLNRKTNRARCWPCGKTYNPIDVLMSRDNFSFVEAVLWLTK